MTAVGLLYDSVSNNTGDVAIGLLIQRALDRASVPYRVVDPFQPETSDLAALIIGGGEIIRAPGHYFYDAFRVPGAHILNTPGVIDGSSTAYLDDYRLVTARSHTDVLKLGHPAATTVPCLTLLYEDYLPDDAPPPFEVPPGAVGVHLTSNFHEHALDFVALLRREGIGPIVWLPVTYYNEDRTLMQALAKHVPGSIVAPPMPADAVFRTIGQLSGLITLSLHATLFAYTQGVPFLSMASPDKIGYFLTERGLQHRLFLNTADIAERLPYLTTAADITTRPADWERCRTALESIITHAQAALTEGPTPITIPPTHRHAYDTEMAFRRSATHMATTLLDRMAHTEFEHIPALENLARRWKTRIEATPLAPLYTQARRIKANLEGTDPHPPANPAYANHLAHHQPPAEPAAAPAVVIPIADLTAERIARTNADFIIPLPPYQTLHPDAAALLPHPTADIVYSDYDHLNTEGHRTDPLYLPDWSPETMLSTDLFAGALAVRRTLLEQVGPPSGPIPEWHLALSRHTGSITHVPRVLAHLHQPAPTPSPGALVDHLAQRGIPHAEVTHPQQAGGHPLPRITWQPATEQPTAIIIPTKDKAPLLRACLQSIRQHTSAPYEVILVDTGSTDPATSALYTQLAGNERVIPYEGEFNFGRACNLGAAHTDAPRLLFLNNDVRINGPGWLERLAQWLDFPDVGLVGSRLLYPSGKIQHAGVVLGMGGFAAHLFQHLTPRRWSPFGSDGWYRTLSAVTGACMLLPRPVFEAAGGWDEGYHLIFSDIALCLAVSGAGYRVVYTPDPAIIHYESQTHVQRMHTADFHRAAERFPTTDPYYNPNLSTAHTTPAFRANPDDTPTTHQQKFIASLPQQGWFTYPDDLIT